MRRARGYSGYYNGVYLRSFLEFAYAFYLDSKNKQWGYEEKIFDLQGVSYKPDFYIYEKDELVKIVEVKGDGNYKVGKEKVDKFVEMYNIPIQLITEKDLVQIYRAEMPMRLHSLRKQWIEKYDAKLVQLVDGKNNPMYGKKHSKKTKELIGKKASERMQNKEYAHSIVEKLIQSNRENNFASCRGERSERETRKCLKCNTEFVVTVHSKKIYCNQTCSAINGLEQATKQYIKNRNEELEQIKNIAEKWALENAEQLTSTPLNKIKERLQPLYKMIEEQFSIKDIRTITKAVTGSYSNRKQLLSHLQNLGN